MLSLSGRGVQQKRIAPVAKWSHKEPCRADVGRSVRCVMCLKASKASLGQREMNDETFPVSTSLGQDDSGRDDGQEQSQADLWITVTMKPFRF